LSLRENASCIAAFSKRRYRILMLAESLSVMRKIGRLCK
jgi:hypothetical protein